MHDKRLYQTVMVNTELSHDKSFDFRSSGLSLKDGVKSSDMWKELRVERLLLASDLDAS